MKILLGIFDLVCLIYHLCDSVDSWMHLRGAVAAARKQASGHQHYHLYNNILMSQKTLCGNKLYQYIMSDISKFHHFSCKIKQSVQAYQAIDFQTMHQ